MTTQNIDDSSIEPTPVPYLQQVARAYRFFDKYERSRNSRHRMDDGASFNDLEDYLWSFFQNCWHIKDWLRNDPTVSDDVKEAVYEAVTSTESIMIAADLANGSKHFSSDPKRQYKGARDSSIEIHSLRDGGFMVEHTIELADGRRLRAIDVARQAMDDWQRILKRDGLSYFSMWPSGEHRG